MFAFGIRIAEFWVDLFVGRFGWIEFVWVCEMDLGELS